MNVSHIVEPLRGLATPVASLKLDPSNARRHGERNLQAIRDSLQRFGQRKSIVALEDGTVIAGNGTLEAAKLLGWETLAVVRVKDDHATATAYAIADNRTAELAEWDEAELARQIAALDQIDHEVALATGFDEAEIKAYIEATIPVEERKDPDAIPTKPEPRVKPGELWALGEHRLLCGDATKLQDLERLMGTARASAVWTDPPYNVALGMDETPEQAAARNRRTDGKVVTNDKMTDSDFLSFLTHAFSNAKWALLPGGGFYIAHADSEGLNFRTAVRDAGLLMKQCLVWVKSSLVMGRQDYQWRHEPILYGWAPGAAHAWYSDRTQTTVLEFDKPSRSPDHPTTKPVELVVRCLENSTATNQIVLDPFLGSGTTIVAAEKLARRCYGLEIDPAYCDVVIERWQQFTGGLARRLD